MEEGNAGEGLGFEAQAPHLLEEEDGEVGVAGVAVGADGCVEDGTGGARGGAKEDEVAVEEVLAV